MTGKKKFVLLLLVLALPAAAGAASIKYTYDAAGRLTREAYSDGTVVEYIYDAAGNRTGHKVGPSTTTTSSPTSTTTTTAVGTTTTISPTSTTTTQPTTTTSIGGTTTTTVCPATRVLGTDNPKLENLRDFRDTGLTRSRIGRRIIQLYYNNAATINAALERSPALRAVARRVLEVLAPMVGK